MNCEPELLKCNHCDYYKVTGELSGKCMKHSYKELPCIDYEQLISDLIGQIKLRPVTDDDIEKFYKDLEERKSKCDIQN